MKTASCATSWHRYGLKAGDTVVSSAAADIKPGNCLPLANIPVGTVIHNIELKPGRGAQLCPLRRYVLLS